MCFVLSPVLVGCWISESPSVHHWPRAGAGDAGVEAAAGWRSQSGSFWQPDAAAPRGYTPSDWPCGCGPSLTCTALSSTDHPEGQITSKSLLSVNADNRNEKGIEFSTLRNQSPALRLRISVQLKNEASLSWRAGNSLSTLVVLRSVRSLIRKGTPSRLKSEKSIQSHKSLLTESQSELLPLFSHIQNGIIKQNKINR